MTILAGDESSAAAAGKMLLGKSPFSNDSPLAGNTYEDLSHSLCKFEIWVITYYTKALFLLWIPQSAIQDVPENPVLLSL